MTQKEMFEASFNRPHDYFLLSSKEQQEIDDRLGILDWEGTKNLNLTDEELFRYVKHYRQEV